MQEGTPSPDLAAETMDILHILGFRVASDPVLFTKIIRIVGYALGRHLGTAAPPEASDRVHQVAFGPPLPAQLGNTGQVCPLSMPIQTSLVWQAFVQYTHWLSLLSNN